MGLFGKMVTASVVSDSRGGFFNKGKLITISQTTNGIVSISSTFGSSQEYYLLNFQWEQYMKDKGKKFVTRSIVGGLIAGPAGMLVGGATGKRKVEDNSIAVLTIQDSQGIIENIVIDCTFKEANKFKGFSLYNPTALPSANIVYNQKVKIEPTIQNKKLKPSNEFSLRDESGFLKDELMISNKSQNENFIVFQNYEKLVIYNLRQHRILKELDLSFEYRVDELPPLPAINNKGWTFYCSNQFSPENEILSQFKIIDVRGVVKFISNFDSYIHFNLLNDNKLSINSDAAFIKFNNGIWSFDN